MPEVWNMKFQKLVTGSWTS